MRDADLKQDQVVDTHVITYIIAWANNKGAEPPVVIQMDLFLKRWKRPILYRQDKSESVLTTVQSSPARCHKGGLWPPGFEYWLILVRHTRMITFYAIECKQKSSHRVTLGARHDPEPLLYDLVVQVNTRPFFQESLRTAA